MASVVMTRHAGRWLCFVGELPEAELLELAERVVGGESTSWRDAASHGSASQRVSQGGYPMGRS